MSYAVLRITDGTTTIDFLSDPTGIMLASWRPKVPAQKEGGLYGSSSFNSGRTLLYSADENIIDQMTINCTGPDPDWVIEKIADLRRLLEKAKQYWTSEAQNEPVWIEAQGRCETNIRYSTIINYSLPEDNDPYEISQGNSVAAQIELSLTLEHQYWQAQVPGTQDCVPITDQRTVTNLYSAVFNGTTSKISCGSDASVDDLHGASFCVEAWIKPHNYGEGNNGMIACKSNAAFNVGWYFKVSNLFGLEAYARYAGGTAFSRATLPMTILDGSWHHVAAELDFALQRWDIFYDGVEVAYTSHVAGAGAVNSDAGENLILGNDDTAANTFDGEMGWLRIRTGAHYIGAAPFTPPSRCILPVKDVTTLGIWIYQASSTDFRNAVGTTALDGTGTAMSTSITCYRTIGEVNTCEMIPVSSYYTAIDITNVFWWDNAPGVWSDNLQLGTFPVAATPAVPAASDYLYVGSCDEFSTGFYDNPYGPFQNFIIKYVAAPGVGFAVLQYWSSAAGGSWVAVPGFQQILIGGNRQLITFNPPSTWITTTINGGTGWWVRLDISGSALTNISQALYCANRPHVDILAADVQGDIDALLTIELTNQHITTIYGTLLALVSLDRNPAFIHALPASTYYNAPIYVEPILIGAGTFSYSPSDPDGGHMQVAFAAAGVDVMAWKLYGFMGRVRIIPWLFQTAGALGDTTVQPDVFINTYVFGETFPVPITTPLTSDLKLVMLTTPQMNYVSNREVYLEMNVENLIAGARTICLYGVLIIPVEEWVGDFFTSSTTYGIAVTGDTIRIATDRPKLGVYSNVYNSLVTLALGGALMNSSCVTPPILHPNKNQRLCIAPRSQNCIGGIGRGTYCVQLWKTERYLSMRGSR